MGNDNVIEFNGKRYDAITGKLLGKSHTGIIEPLAPQVSSRRTIDGVVSHNSHRKSRNPVQAHRLPSVTKQVRPKTSHTPAVPIKPHRPETAKTLMRRAVHKPSATMKPAIKTQTPAEVIAKPISAIAVKQSVHQVDPERKRRASQTPKSQAVQRFNPPAELQKTFHYAAPQPGNHRVVHPKITPQHTKTDIFEAAMARAASHQQPAHAHHTHKHHKQRRLTGLVAGLVLCLMLGGLIAYLNRAAIELKVASFHAGFTADLPAYKPTGFELTDIQNRPGQIVLNYRSGAHSFQLTQQPTDWNSRTLGDSIIASADSQPIQSNGRTIYIYDGIASWVSGGVRYDITGNAELGRDEIAAIAASM